MHFVCVDIPICHQQSIDGSLKVYSHLLGAQSWAKDEKDLEKMVEEEIMAFCILAENFGDGIEKELQVLGWRIEYQDADESLLIYKPPESEIGFALRQHVNEQRFQKQLQIF